MSLHQHAFEAKKEGSKFVFSRKARSFPIVDARPYRWPSNPRDADDIIEDWRSRAGQALGALKLSKKTMQIIASHTSRKDGRCTLSDAALSSRTGRSIPSVKRDVCRMKKMGFLMAETTSDVEYRKRRRILQLSIPDVLDGDQRIPSHDDQRIDMKTGYRSGSTYTPYADPSDKGERRDV